MIIEPKMSASKELTELLVQKYITHKKQQTIRHLKINYTDIP